MTSSPPAPPGTNDQLSLNRSSRPTTRETRHSTRASVSWRVCLQPAISGTAFDAVNAQGFLLMSECTSITSPVNIWRCTIRLIST